MWESQATPDRAKEHLKSSSCVDGGERESIHRAQPATDSPYRESAAAICGQSGRSLLAVGRAVHWLASRTIHHAAVHIVDYKRQNKVSTLATFSPLFAQPRYMCKPIRVHAAVVYCCSVAPRHSFLLHRLRMLESNVERYGAEAGSSAP